VEVQKTSFLAIFAISIFIALFPDISIAAPGDTIDNTVGTQLCQIVASLMGGIGKSIAILAVIILGISAFFGKATWQGVVLTAVGASVVFGADLIAGTIIGVDITCLSQ